MSAATEPVGERPSRAIRGPSALSDDPRRFWHLTVTIAKNEFRLRFFGSALGYAWQLMRPLMLFGVLYVVFTKVVKAGGTSPHFPVLLLAGVVLMTFFSEATSGSVRCVVDRETLVRKIQFPRLAIPLSVVLTASFNLAMNLVVVAIFAFASGVTPEWSWLELPLVVALLIVLATGFSMLLSALFVRFRDLQPIWDVVLQVMFYATPVIYPIEKVITRKGSLVGISAHTFRHIYMSNPLSVVLVQFRRALVPSGVQNGIVVHSPSAATAIGGWTWMAIPLGFTAAMFVIGFVVFNRAARHIAEDL